MGKKQAALPRCQHGFGGSYPIFALKNKRETYKLRTIFLFICFPTTRCAFKNYSSVKRKL